MWERIPAAIPQKNSSRLEAAPSLPIDFLKIHQLQVVKNTPLEILYREKPFHTFEYSEYLEFIVEFIERLSAQIVLQRLFATAPDNILVAPRWSKSRQEILRDIEKILETKDTFQGKKLKIPAGL